MTAFNLDISTDEETVHSIKAHTTSGCALAFPLSPSKLTVRQLMSQPADAPPMKVEKTSIVKRILNTSPQQSPSAEIISLPAAGQVTYIHNIMYNISDAQHTHTHITSRNIQFQPLTLARVTKSRVATPDAASSTKRRRSSELAGVRETISGGEEAASAQLQEKIGKEGRRKLMEDPVFARPISVEESLLMKTSMGLPWHKIRQGRRYTITIIVQLAD